ncbi:glycosyltransferase [Patescibacteria group bacterium]|nr:glycosyltransferase [Patescibacteria group bacterium]
MISIIITTCREEGTLLKAIDEILRSRLDKNYKIEILVIGPDKQTAKIVTKLSQRYKYIKYLKDKAEGKPAALNLAFKKAKGDILILTDGDVYIDNKGLESLIRPFKDKKIGAITGRPVSLNSRKQMLGYWSHFLTHAAHKWRMTKTNFPCSGYLYSFRNIISQIPKNVLAEDGLITQIIKSKGYNISYSPKSIVYVKYPDNFKDWMKQKLRSTGGYKQKFIQTTNHKLKTRTFWQEIKDGVILFLFFPKTIKEFLWTFVLFLARIYLWFLIFLKIKIFQPKLAKIWQRVESTK